MREHDGTPRSSARAGFLVAKLVVLVLALTACRNRHDSVQNLGDEGQMCYPNDTCDVTLSCVTLSYVRLRAPSVAAQVCKEVNHAR